ncbi:hypothetical protein B0H63DRAFT_536315 [Podospora didyma]|uniref:Uncharacterized protein n=1 Tax=Podospora didyma TaxID=330526 RepID=A0AAE0JXR8_9PEZI|nr:hypothetical protein B0H63DRAFT_536315 [Podospora didyma]
MTAWQVPDLATFNATGHLGDVGDCISESCTIKGKLGDCPDELDTLEGVKITTANLGSIASQMTLYYNDVNVNLNNDIARPGVILSYFLQAGLAFFLYLLLKATTTFAPRLDALLHRRHRKAKRPLRIGMRWWYTFTLATFAFAFAIGLFARRNSLMPAPDDLWANF